MVVTRRELMTLSGTNWLSDMKRFDVYSCKIFRVLS
ncbi:unnamed protein product [Trichobilharzia regenti]|nr:unnamed protein product [Trichobilharzia regenti]